MATHSFLDKTGLQQLWTKIKALIVQPNWTQTDTSQSSYIQNKPPIQKDPVRAGIIEGQLDPSEQQDSWVIQVTGAANVTTYNYVLTTSGTLPSAGDLRRNGTAIYMSYECRGIVNINTTNQTITFNKTLNADSALTGAIVVIYVSYKTAAENAHAEGYLSRAAGNASHAEGRITIAAGDYSHAEGWFTSAMGQYSHTEGYDTIAQGQATHAEGWGCQTLNYGAHAEGYYAKALGVCSHSEGQYTTAQRKSQHVFGEYNVLDTSGNSGTRGAYVEIVGKGTADNARSNARTLDWSGNEVLAGKLTVGAGPTNNMDAATKQYVDTSYVIAGKLANTTLGSNATAEGYNTTSSAVATHAEGSLTKATDYAAHAEGVSSQANGYASHAEGYSTTASTSYTHAEGYSTTASASYSHAEGYNTTASGSCSHTEGNSTVAGGAYSHAEGYGTQAEYMCQHVFGEYNVSDNVSGGSALSRGNYVEIVGNGTGSSARSNARTLDWNGNEVLAGKLTVGAGPTAPMDVATKQYVDNNAPSGPAIFATTVTLTASEWSNSSQTVNVTEVTASNIVIVTYAPASKADYVAADIACTAQGSGTLTFSCSTVPSSNITVNVLVIDNTISAAAGNSF